MVNLFLFDRSIVRPSTRVSGVWQGDFKDFIISNSKCEQILPSSGSFERYQNLYQISANCRKSIVLFYFSINNNPYNAGSRLDLSSDSLGRSSEGFLKKYYDFIYKIWYEIIRVISRITDVWNNCLCSFWNTVSNKKSKLSACYSMLKSKFLNKLNLVVLAIHSLKFSRGYFFKTFFLRKIKDRNSEGIILGN